MTTPGFHNDTNFNDYPKKFTDAINEIGRHFYVTRSFSSESIGNSNYWGLLARPADNFSVQLNADRELLFVFSPYDDFEIRTLEAFDEFYAQLEQKRVDKSLRFLISSDPRVEDIVKHYLNQNPEYPIIIPVYLPNLSKSGNPLLDAIRRNYLLRDLFGYQNPLREETFFFGRQDLVNEILDLAKSGQSSSLFGLRKSGKTSTIYAIMRRAKLFSCTPILVDCQNPVIHTQNYRDLLHHVINLVREAIGQKKRKDRFNGTDSEISQQFSNDLKSILGQAKSNILLIFDEIENISPQTAASAHWDTGTDCLYFWQNLRSFMQEEKSGRVSVCLVGTSPLLLEQPKIGAVANPMYLHSQKRFIQSLSFDETKEMIERLGFFMGIHLSATQIGRIQEMYGGHPFFTRQVCSNVHQIAGHLRPIDVSNTVLDEAIQRFGGQLEMYLRDILSNLESYYPEEFKLLEKVTRGDHSELNEYGNVAPDLIDHLVGYGLIEQRGKDFDIRYEAVKNAMERVLDNPDASSTWKEVSARRNTLETEIRRELFSYSKSLDGDSWKETLKRCLTNTRYQRLPSLEPRLLFSKTDCPLYWSDLMNILKDEHVLPFIGGRRSSIIEAMQTINDIGRPDAHAKEVTKEKLSKIRSALGLLEEEFCPPA